MNWRLILIFCPLDSKYVTECVDEAHMYLSGKGGLVSGCEYYLSADGQTLIVVINYTHLTRPIPYNRYP